MSEMEKVTILFKEYDSLRSELVGRIAHWYQMGALALLVLGWFVQRGILDRRTMWALGLLVLAGCWFGYMLGRDAYILAGRLRQLEAEINLLAGAELLKWETHYGASANKTYFWRKYPRAFTPPS